MTSNTIICDRLSKTFYIKKRFFAPRQKLEAVQDLSFQIKQGEFTAFIGPNGGGKSTTVKMLTSILYPTSGTATIMGLNPWKERKKLCARIGTVFGQKSQLYYQLPPMDTFHLLATAYDLKKQDTRHRIQELSELLQVDHLLTKPVCRLSLGERMRCEIIAAILHRPDILFLDEPTIGLDITAKQTLRHFLKYQCTQFGTTVFLTSHDMNDIENMCSRVLLINQGKLMLDMPIDALKDKYLHEKQICLRLKNGQEEKMTIDTQKQSLNSEIKKLIADKSFSDIVIREADLESIMTKLYKETKPCEPI